MAHGSLQLQNNCGLLEKTLFGIFFDKENRENIVYIFKKCFSHNIFGIFFHLPSLLELIYEQCVRHNWRFVRVNLIFRF